MHLNKPHKSTYTIISDLSFSLTSLSLRLHLVSVILFFDFSFGGEEDEPSSTLEIKVWVWALITHPGSCPRLPGCATSYRNPEIPSSTFPLLFILLQENAANLQGKRASPRRNLSAQVSPWGVDADEMVWGSGEEKVNFRDLRDMNIQNSSLAFLRHIFNKFGSCSGLLSLLFLSLRERIFLFIGRRHS